MILNNCRLVPALTPGVQAEMGAVRISGDKIAAVSDHVLTQQELAAFAGENVMDAGGKTLLPGFIDMHTHMTLLGGVGTDVLYDPMQLLVASAQQTTRYLDYGFTTIRDCGSFHRVANYVRQMTASGLVTGPNVLACGKGLMTTVVNPDEPRAAHICFTDGPEEFRKAVRTEAAHGASFIKIFASGSAYNPSGKPQLPLMTDDELNTVTQTAHNAGLPVASHCHSDSSIQACIRAGVDTIEHATFLSDRSLELLAKGSSKLVPTFSAMFVSQTDPAERKFWLDRLNPMLDACAAGISKAYQAGFPLGFGTDSAAGSKQFEQGIEFRYRKEYCGMADLDILKQATCVSAELLGMENQVGKIAGGLLADLVLVDGKPDADISCLYHRPEHVWKSGKMVR